MYLSSYESDEQYLDNMTQESLTDPAYMSDEERDHWNDLSEGETEEATEEVTYESADDVVVDNLFNTCFGVSTKQSKSQRRATKKAQVKNASTVHLSDDKPKELAYRWGATFRGAN